MVRPSFQAFLFVLVLVLVACSRNPWVVYRGHTMGTTFTIKWNDGGSFSKTKQNETKEAIYGRLQELNSIFSTYDTTSAISKFNASKTLKEQACNDELNKVLKLALVVAGLSDGSYDPTLAPVIALWGFNSEKELEKIPSNYAINKERAKVGHNKLKLPKGAASICQKLNPLVSANLSSIAKGYAVDQMSELLSGAGYQHYFVDIGGEIRVSGNNQKDKEFWTIGINTPRSDASPNDVFMTVPLTNQSIATSGTYRIFHRKSGKDFNHIIDGKTGHPIQHSTKSVSIITEKCVLADALATVALILGRAKGEVFLKTYYPDVSYLFIDLDKTGKLVSTKSETWPELIQ